MGHDVASHWLLRVNSVGHPSSWVGHHLVGHVDCHIELLTDLFDLVEHPAHDLLPLSQLSSSRVVHSEGVHDGIDHQHRIRVFTHGYSCMRQQSIQHVHGVRLGYHYIVQHLLRVQLVPRGYRLYPLRSEGMLGVDVKSLALPPSLTLRQLGSHAQIVGKLGLSTPELSEGLCYALALNPSLQKLVEATRSRGDSFDLLAPLEDGHSRLETNILDFHSRLEDLLSLALGDSSNAQHFFFRS